MPSKRRLHQRRRLTKEIYSDGAHAARLRPDGGRLFNTQLPSAIYYQIFRVLFFLHFLVFFSSHHFITISIQQIFFFKFLFRVLSTSPLNLKGED